MPAADAMNERIYDALRDAMEQQRPTVLRTALSARQGNVSEELRREMLVVDAVSADGKGVVSPFLTEQNGALVFDEPVLPPERMLLLGGGHVAQPVCAFAAACGFRVTVVDDRPSFANRTRFPDAVEVVCDGFAHAIAQFHPGAYDYVVIVTRGHAHDAECLRWVLTGDFPAYVGMIGSRRRVKAQLELLAEEGFDRDKLAKVCTPIGLSIGSVTPEEIGVSILAQVISYRRLPQFAAAGRWVNGSDLEPEMIRYLAENREPKAVVTILSAKGSTPRKAGAKMAVSPLGQVTGSIGGGCAESEVMQRARKLIGTGGFEVFHVDMTGEVAEEEGMVCGGVMDVLIEDDIG